jgi:hypothetical protein
VGTPIFELTAIDLITIAAIVVFERTLKVDPTKLIQYDRIELIKPEKEQELIEDLEKRTGLKINKVDVGAIDFLRDMAMLRVHYDAVDGADMEINNKIKIKNSEYANI